MAWASSGFPPTDRAAFPARLPTMRLWLKVPGASSSRRRSAG